MSICYMNQNQIKENRSLNSGNIFTSDSGSRMAANFVMHSYPLTFLLNITNLSVHTRKPKRYIGRTLTINEMYPNKLVVYFIYCLRVAGYKLCNLSIVIT